MAFSYACLTLQRVVLPIILVLDRVSCPIAIIIIYNNENQNYVEFLAKKLLLLLFSARMTLRLPYTTTCSTTNYFGIGFLITLALDIGDSFGTCTVIERLLRHVGFIGFKNLKVLAIIEWLVPEVVVFITALVVYLVTKKITQKVEQLVENGNVDAADIEESLEASGTGELTAVKVNNDVGRKQQLEDSDKPNFDGLIKISPLFCLATLFFSAVLRPSVPGGFYFLIFLLSGSYWASFQTLQRKFAILLRLVMVVIVAHTICIVAYQTPWMQDHLDKTSLTARLIGLEPLITSTCANDIRIIVYDTQFKADSFLNPIVLFFTYYALALTTKNLIKARLMRSATRKSATTTTDNNSGITPQQQQQPNNDIPLSSMDANQSADVEYKSGICDQIWYGITGIGGFIYQNSYIFTNVLMMAWSIVYHSWLTFVLLLWANVLWMIPNQRKAMMRSSPFIVIYAELLLIAQYIYGMDLTNDELPSKVDISGINLKQIGFERPQENGMQPCIPLIVKASFLLMFWVTLRQFFKEKTDKRRDSTLADIFAPLQLSVGHSIGDQGQVGGKKTSKFLKKMGIVIKNLLVRLWIWLLVLVIFLCAMTGEKMTGFRICYMALFLFFLLVFQSSSKAWVKLMYGFWLFLIFYAMSILILIYTYQFDKFDKYWEQYLNISTTLQTDIGLERYKTKDLFLHLVSPTIIVILTVIQVHYFHKRFIASMNQPTEAVERDSEEEPVRHKSRTTSRVAESEGLEFVESAGNLIRLFLNRCRHKTEVFFKHFKGVIWRLLELHWIKVVYITAFVCAVSEVSLLHVPFVALCVVGVVSNVRMNFFFSRLISLVVTIIVLSKMIYQIAYLNHAKYDYNCPNENGQYKGNNAEWFGLYKASPEFGLMGLLKRYIIYMVIATLHAVIALRQYQMRRLKGIQNDPLPKVAFPGVGREDAEKKLEGMIKYLLNFGFYKFGYEICLVALVSTITYRQDIVAVAYSVWLILLLLFKRKKNAHIWGVLQVFILTSILVQYVLLVELPPSMCIEYVWVNTKYSEALQRWAMLPGDLHYDHTKKLIFDFVLLLLVNRQKRVFTLENVPNYPGGSNKSVIKDIANLDKVDFENPTHDFLSHIRNYLDIFKHAVLCGFYWVTLAVVFLAGTNISDFLAIGYLIGAFMFLWEGSDFYLRPIRSITTRWKWLLAYNVTNIVIKTSLQMVGCLFMDTLQMKCCWAVHLLGISCSSKDIMSEITSDTANGCPSITVQSVLLWDAICFAFLIFQLRIFKSHYFCHIISDTRANNILASRGAEIIERLRQKQIEKRQDYEEEVLYKIKRKMEKIRATQQKMLRPQEKPTHFDVNKETALKLAPLAHCNSFLSCQGSGYHTPDEEDIHMNTASTASITSCSSNNGSEEDLSKIYINTEYADIKSISDYGDNLNKNTKQFINLPEIEIEPHTQPLTPTSDVLTIPLEGFLEAPRLSMYSHRTPSDLSHPKYDISEGSNEVFYANTNIHRPSPVLLSARTLQADVSKSNNGSIISSNVTNERRSSFTTRHRRQSSVNAVSWNDTVSIKCATPSKPLQKQEELHVTMRKRLLHRRHQSVGNAKYPIEDNSHKHQDSNRRLSNLSWAQEEALMRYSKRPNSWGPVGTDLYATDTSMLYANACCDLRLHGQCIFIFYFYYFSNTYQGTPIYGSRPHKRKEIKLHPQAVRAGDYYMFEDVDDKFELEVITDSEGLFDTDNENITDSEIKMSRRKTLYDVWKDISSVQYRRQVYLRQRSYASAPPSHIGLLFDDHQTGVDIDAGVGNRNSTLSEPLCYAHRSTSEYFVSFSESQKPKNIKDGQTDMGPSTSKVGEIHSRPHTSEMKQKTEVDSGDTGEDSDADFQANPIIRLMEAFLVSLTIRLNRFSRNYRYVNKILAEEKKALKESKIMGRFSTKNALYCIMKHNLSSDEGEDAATAPSTSSKRNSNNALNNITNIQEPPQNNHNTYEPMQSPNPQLPPPLPTSQPPLPTTATTSTIQSSDIQQYNDEAIFPLDVVDARSKESIADRNSKIMRGRKSEPLPEIRIKAPSFDRGRRGSGSVISKQWSQEKVTSTEIAFDDEDFTARDHNIIIEVLISAWYAILSNTDLICYIVVFINQVVNASLISLPLPLMVFLWGTLSLPRPTKTFWVTLIAYTQAIVLIKCIFQFKLIWVNYHYNLPNNPLGIEKLFGIEMSSDYATYDLLLLLVLFFHRFILKSHGLWKIDNKSSEKESSSKSTLNDMNADEDADSERRNSAGSDRNSEQRLTVSPNDLVKRVGNLQRNKYMSGLTKFFHNLVHKARLPTDVYALMFLCDFINFFVLLFGFTAFSSKQADGGVKTYLAENKVPIPFLIMLLVQFVLIVIDRALYLRKALVYKIIFHFISVVGIHVWMFFIVPAVTERSFYASAPPIIFYIIKCFYLLLSSYQIKCGYPNRILGNFLTKSFSMINMISFKIYMLIPFLYELRTILDWLCTDTTMTLFDWLKMEDIFANIYSIKCLRQMETDFPAVRAQKKATFMKLLMGGSAILLIVFALWGPLTLFALSGAVGQSNVPTEVKISIRIGSYDPIYVASTRESSFRFDESMFSAMKDAYIKDKDKEALSFLLNYDATDVAAIKLKRNSPSMWNIAPPDKARLLSELESNVTLVVRLSYELTRTPPVKNQVGTVGSEITWEMTADYADRKNLENMIRTGNENDTDVTIPNIVPKFIKVLNSGDPTYISALVPKGNVTKNSDFTNMSISMNSAGNTSLWWEISDYCGGDETVSTLLRKLPLYDCSSGIVFYTFNDKKFPSTWTFLTGGGIIGLYTTFVLLASRFLKNFLGGQTRRIMHEDLPNVDRVLQLCLDIYLVREALEFMLEEDLFAKLIFLYRSPETMIKWTRLREEIADDETDSDSVRSRMSGRRNDHPQPANVQ
ncbi:piezo-type mechanosensitive ion channel component [Calliphora vicina]|uniref:piezo-type mechanosensitive ion channel component n=1 Tax=Calliphora vicina TaxID=7373 RepID=UPI00325A71C9